MPKRWKKIELFLSPFVKRNLNNLITNWKLLVLKSEAKIKMSTVEYEMSTAVPSMEMEYEMSTTSSEPTVGHLFIEETIKNKLVDAMKDTLMKCVEELANKYQFSKQEALASLFHEEAEVKIVASAEKSEKQKKQKTEKQNKTDKPSIPMPFNGQCNMEYCSALKSNGGLYTQCHNKRENETEFCHACNRLMLSKNLDIPEHGTVQQRMACGLYEYKDPKGKAPIHYTKIMAKLNLTREKVEEEAAKFGIVIPEEHFCEPEKVKRGRPKSDKPPAEKKPKGRPKKNEPVVENADDGDLFATLVAQAVAEKEPVSAEPEQEPEMEGGTIVGETAEDVVAWMDAQCTATEKEAEKEAEKQRKAAEKASKPTETTFVPQVPPPPVETAPTQAPEQTTEPAEHIRVKKITYEGKKYLKSSNGIVYDFDAYLNEQQQVVVGRYDETENKIIFEQEDEEEEDNEEEEEEEYEF